MIVDFHTHIFPPRLIAERADCARRDPLFAEMYGDPGAKMATAEDLLRSMDAAGVDVSVVLGFAWEDDDLCRRHNDYLLEQSARSGGRIVAFCTVDTRSDAGRDEMRRCAREGARGLGELRSVSHDPGFGGLSRDLGLVLLFHASEPVGHAYPGKHGAALADIVRLAGDLPDVPIVAAHWGGGLPFYTLMPEVREALGSTYFDTAASRYLYSPDIFRRAIELVGARRILFGSDYPLIGQKAALSDLRAAGLTAEEVSFVQGDNAGRLLGLT